MFEAMMQRFQEDTLRNLYRMQIVGPDGIPIESLEQLEALRNMAAQPVAPPPPQLPQAPPPMRMSGGSEVEQQPRQPEPSQFPAGRGPQRQQYAPQKATSGQKPKRRR